MLLLIFHAACVLLYGYTIKFDYYLAAEFNLHLPIPGMFISKFVWLTIVNLYVQASYHAIATLLLIYEKQIRKASRFRAQFSKYSTTIVFPIAVTVVILFWGLIFLNPNFLLNEEAKKVMSYAWFNHTIHTFPLIAVVIDHIAWKHRRTKKLQSFLIIFVFVSAYLSWLHYIHYVYGFWAYPILGELSTLLRLFFIAFCALFFFTAYLLGDLLLYVSQTTIGKPTSTITTRAKKNKKN